MPNDNLEFYALWDRKGEYLTDIHSENCFYRYSCSNCGFTVPTIEDIPPLLSECPECHASMVIKFPM